MEFLAIIGWNKYPTSLAISCCKVHRGLNAASDGKSYRAIDLKVDRGARREKQFPDLRGSRRAARADYCVGVGSAEREVSCVKRWNVRYGAGASTIRSIQACARGV